MLLMGHTELRERKERMIQTLALWNCASRLQHSRVTWLTCPHLLHPCTIMNLLLTLHSAVGIYTSPLLLHYEPLEVDCLYGQAPTMRLSKILKNKYLQRILMGWMINHSWNKHSLVFVFILPGTCLTLNHMVNSETATETGMLFWVVN